MLNRQKQFLEDLISFKEQPAMLKKLDVLGFQDWYDEPLAIITRKQVSSVLERFLDDKLSARDIYDWAESLAGRSTIGYEEKYEVLLFAIIMNLVTDYITGLSLTKKQATAYLAKLADT